MEDTIFGKIIRREIPADIVYEDADTLAFLDINPNNPGHTLVVPKKPIRNIFEADDTTLATLMRATRIVANAIRKAGLAEGVNIIINNEPAADQVIFHLHAHIVPRLSTDTFGFSSWPHKSYAPGEARPIAEKIRAALS